MIFVGGAALAVATLLTPLPASAADDDCTDRDRSLGLCVEGEVVAEEVILTGTEPGRTSTTTNPRSPAGTTADPGEYIDILGDNRWGVPCEPVPTPGCGVWSVTALTPTLNDIAAFRPAPEVNHMEPNGWFVVGLDANFYATGEVHVVDGTLLGQPASVRFTPIRWRWDYGDGDSATRSTRGATWSDAGIREFYATPTSHVYDQAGTYYIDLTVGYRAEYRFAGQGWAPIAGTLWLPSNRLVATVGGAKTVLVERDCTANRSGPGC